MVDQTTQLTLINKMSKGAIDALLLRRSHVAARTNGLTPQEDALFKLRVDLYVSVANAGALKQGGTIDTDSFIEPASTLNLETVVSADVDWVDTGSAVDPFGFGLTNVVTL